MNLESAILKLFIISNYYRIYFLNTVVILKYNFIYSIGTHVLDDIYSFVASGVVQEQLSLWTTILLYAGLARVADWCLGCRDAITAHDTAITVHITLSDSRYGNIIRECADSDVL